MSDGPETEALPPPERGLPERLRLVVVSGPDQGKTFDLARGTYQLGKDPEADLVLADPAVSRRHLELVVQDDAVVARDLGSKNGSYFQGARFSQMNVGVGEVLRVGGSELRIVGGDRAIPIPPSTRDHFGGLIGSSLAMREAFAILERVAGTDSAVLIEGETGTGKELCAEALHQHSARRDGPFVVCDLAGISRSLIESELFGHKKGAFTGADRDRDGAFVQAHGGTLFLDELGELELEMQPRLLRALAAMRIKPVGDSRYRDVDVRVVAATNRDLREEVRAGRFRADLFHRLAVVRVRLPPLRERKDDIPRLVDAVVRDHDARVTPEAMALFTEYDWPGNVRELRNLTERMLSLVGSDRLLSPSLLGGDAFEDAVDDRGGSGLRVNPDERFREAKEKLIEGWERAYLTEVLRRSSGNVSEAARRSGLDRAYLHRLLKKHQLAGGDGE